jgi:hypothetical protein
MVLEYLMPSMILEPNQEFIVHKLNGFGVTAEIVPTSIWNNKLIITSEEDLDVNDILALGTFIGRASIINQVESLL